MTKINDFLTNMNMTIQPDVRTLSSEGRQSHQKVANIGCVYIIDKHMKINYN